MECLLKRVPANDRVTYVFGGETGALDHAYASFSAVASVPTAVTVTGASRGGSATLAALSVSWSDGAPKTTLTAASVARHTYPSAGSYTVAVTLTNSDAQ